MEALTRELWAKQDRHQGDRLRLLSTVARHLEAERVLYPGSFVDVAASFVWPSVTYVDSDRRAASFFHDSEGVGEIVLANQLDSQEHEVKFVPGDYTADLGCSDQSFDLLISLYAGFVSEHCTRYLSVGGHLLVNPSHGDAAMASIDERYRLVAAVKSHGSSGYAVDDQNLERYLVAKKPQPITVERLHELGRGIGYTNPSFSYLFERVG